MINYFVFLLKTKVYINYSVCGLSTLLESDCNKCFIRYIIALILIICRGLSNSFSRWLKTKATMEKVNFSYPMQNISISTEDSC